MSVNPEGFSAERGYNQRMLSAPDRCVMIVRGGSKLITKNILIYCIKSMEMKKNRRTIRWKKMNKKKMKMKRGFKNGNMQTKTKVFQVSQIIL